MYFYRYEHFTNDITNASILKFSGISKDLPHNIEPTGRFAFVSTDMNTRSQD